MPTIEDLYASIPGLKQDYKVDWIENTRMDWKEDWIPGPGEPGGPGDGESLPFFVMAGSAAVSGYKIPAYYAGSTSLEPTSLGALTVAGDDGIYHNSVVTAPGLMACTVVSDVDSHVYLRVFSAADGELTQVGNDVPISVVSYPPIGGAVGAVAIDGNRVYAAIGHQRESDSADVIDLIAVDVDVVGNTATLVGNRLTHENSVQAAAIVGGSIIDGHFCFTSAPFGQPRRFYAFSFDGTDFLSEEVYEAASQFYDASAISLDTGFIFAENSTSTNMTYVSYTVDGGFEIEFAFDLATLNTNPAMVEFFVDAAYFDKATNRMYVSCVDAEYTTYELLIAELNIDTEEWTFVESVPATLEQAYPYGVHDGVVVYPTPEYTMARSATVIDGELVEQPGAVSINPIGYSFVVPYKADEV